MFWEVFVADLIKSGFLWISVSSCCALADKTPKEIFPAWLYKQDFYLYQAASCKTFVSPISAFVSN